MNKERRKGADGSLGELIGGTGAVPSASPLLALDSVVGESARSTSTRAGVGHEFGVLLAGRAVGL